MNSYIEKAGLQVSPQLAEFLEHEVLPDLGLKTPAFWQSFANIVSDLTPRNKALLAERDTLQRKIDEWNNAHKDNFDAQAYLEFLQKIGYLVEEQEAFNITTQNVDSEIASQAGPQLVVPASNARFALNASNARWGSLYDALYGTDAISTAGGAHQSDTYNRVRGEKVIAFCKKLLDDYFPLVSGSHTQVTCYRVSNAALSVKMQDGSTTQLKQPTQCLAYQGQAAAPSSILLEHNGLRLSIEIDADSVIGQTDTAGVKDIITEAATTVIQDFEDSVAAVDAEDKIGIYRNWLGLMKATLVDTFIKDGRTTRRALAADKSYTTLDGHPLTLPGRSLLLCRNVGHLMSNPAILDQAGEPIQEGIMDAVITVLIAMHDLKGLGRYRNSRSGSVYIVKPKMHGPQEVGFSNTLFDRVEDELGLARNTIKIGVMDEERRTTINLKECIRQVKDRLVFINTGFLDRTGDEIHTSMLLGPMATKAEIKRLPWIQAYEDWNVDIGIECGLPGKAQIGKGMWAMPDAMAAMLNEKVAHPRAGANTAWVPSPIAAVLHSTHYHQVNVQQCQIDLATRPRASLSDILTVPLCHDPDTLSAAQIQNELDNNAQGILGYVVRWINQGIGCSKVADINNVGLMEDRATLRISSQHIANWLIHGLCSEAQVIETFERMADVVDRQNLGDPDYQPMANNFTESLAFLAALDLVLKGWEQPNGYTEPLLHEYRLRAKARTA